MAQLQMTLADSEDKRQFLEQVHNAVTCSHITPVKIVMTAGRGEDGVTKTTNLSCFGEECQAKGSYME